MQLPNNKRLQVVIATTLVLALLQGCQKPVAPDVAGLPPLTIPPDAELFRLMPAESQLLVLVYREGSLARLGHNHVISSSAVEGEVYLPPGRSDTVFEIRIPVDEFVIDDPALRAAAGADFPGELDDDAIAGTRANMLGEQQLDAAAWPQIVVRGEVAVDDSAAPAVRLHIQLRSYVHSMVVPVELDLSAESIVATGRFSVLQSDLGLEAFSVMMGALRVRDQLDVEFSLVAAKR